MNEFDIIKQYFAPLAKDFAGSLQLTDDAALISLPAGKELVISSDMLCEGVHFLGTEPAGLIAQKLLRVNLSDLAAKGAEPYCYTLALALPQNVDEEWLRQFAAGLQQDQQTFGIKLAGGDTTHSKHGITLSITAIGLSDKDKMLKRSGAKAGDDIYVSGTLGLACTGFEEAKSGKFTDDKNKYLLPVPRLALGQKLAGIASACMDISDGLMQDLQHLCSASGVGAQVLLADIPLASDGANWQELLTFGDDYELLFTAQQNKRSEIEKLSSALDTPLTRIGTVTTGNAALLLDSAQKEIALTKKGYSHF